jgi:hypothetical protein
MAAAAEPGEELVNRRQGPERGVITGLLLEFLLLFLCLYTW